MDEMSDFLKKTNKLEEQITSAKTLEEQLKYFQEVCKLILKIKPKHLPVFGKVFRKWKQIIQRLAVEHNNNYAKEAIKFIETGKHDYKKWYAKWNCFTV